MIRYAALTIVVVITLTLSSCELGRYFVTGMAKDVYRTVVPESVTTIEEVETLDGASEVISLTSNFYSNRYVFSLESESYPDWVYESEYRVSSDGSALPIVFDVVNKVPWIVMPIKSNQCEQFDSPREGLVFFKLEGKTWKTTSYDQAPGNLKVNLLRNREAYIKGTGMDRASCEFGSYTVSTRSQFGGYVCVGREGGVAVDKDTIRPVKPNYGRVVTPSIRLYLDAKIKNQYRNQYINKDGTGKTIEQIVKRNLTLPNIANRESCYHVNRPADPDERRSLREFVDKKTVVVQAKLVNVLNKVVALDSKQEQAMYVYPKVQGLCSRLVYRQYDIQIAQENQEEFTGVLGTSRGIFKTPGTAVRVELYAQNGVGTNSFYLPKKGFRLGRIDAMSCQPDRIVVDFDRNGNEFLVLEYDMNARLKNKWKVMTSFGPKEWHIMSSLSVDDNHIKITLVDFEKHGYNNGKKIPARMLAQYFYEAELSSQ